MWKNISANTFKPWIKFAFKETIFTGGDKLRQPNETANAY